MDKEKLDNIIQNIQRKKESSLNKYSKEIKYFLDNNLSQKEIVKLLKEHFNTITTQQNLSYWIRKNNLTPKYKSKSIKNKTPIENENRKTDTESEVDRMLKIANELNSYK